MWADKEKYLKLVYIFNSFQGYKVELASKQLTMDFVNQAVLQPGPHEIDIPHEKLDYAEKLTELNQHWTKVSLLEKRRKSYTCLMTQTWVKIV